EAGVDVLPELCPGMTLRFVELRERRRIADARELRIGLPAREGPAELVARLAGAFARDETPAECQLLGKPTARAGSKLDHAGCVDRDRVLAPAARCDHRAARGLLAPRGTRQLAQRGLFGECLRPHAGRKSVEIPSRCD